MYIGLLVFLSVIAVVALNIASGKTVSSSEIHSDAEKRKFLLMIWLLPIVGTMLAMWFINKDIRKSQHEMEDEIAPAIKELGDRLKKLETRIHQKQNNQKLH
jgi:hypothetical protein